MEKLTEHSDPDSPESKFVHILQYALGAATLMVIETACGYKEGESWTPKQDEAMLHNAGAYLNAMDPTRTVRTFETFMEKASSGADIAKEFRLTYPVCQPFTITKELLKRIKELAIKFISTSKIITMGGVMMSEEQRAKMNTLNSHNGQTPTVAAGDH